MLVTWRTQVNEEIASFAAGAMCSTRTLQCHQSFRSNNHSLFHTTLSTRTNLVSPAQVSSRTDFVTGYRPETGFIVLKGRCCSCCQGSFFVQSTSGPLVSFHPNVLGFSYCVSMQSAKVWSRSVVVCNRSFHFRASLAHRPSD